MKLLYCLFISLICTQIHAQIITTIAGNGMAGYSGNNGPATSASLGWPIGIVMDNSGNLYITEHDNNIIRKVDNAGIITVFAGTGPIGYTGDGGPATSAKLYHPTFLTMDQSGNLYFFDQVGVVIRKITPAGIITSITGNLPPGYSGDGGPLMLAQFKAPSGLQFDNAGNLYISDWGANVIRKVNSAGIISTVVGTGVQGSSGDGGPATAATLYHPYGVVFRSNGDMYFPEAGNQKVKVVNTAGIINTYAGTGVAGYSGDGGPANQATLFCPFNATVDAADNIYLVDGCNNVVRKIDNGNIITTFAGTGVAGYSGDGGLATQAQMIELSTVTKDVHNNIFIVNKTWPNVIRKVTNCLTATISQQPTDVELCNSGNASFSVAATNSTSFQWQVNTGSGWVNLSDNAIYAGSATPDLLITGATIAMHNYQFRCSVTNSCGPIFSTSGVLKVNTPSAAAISINASTLSVCSGDPVTFTAVPQNGGTSPIYKWKKNTVSVGTNSNSYVDNALINGDAIICSIVSNSNCVTINTANSNTITMTVTPKVTPSVNITASANNVCFGTPVTFTATPVNGGTPNYAWFKNGINQSVNAATYTDNALNNGDAVSCVVTSSLTCLTASTASSSPITISIIPTVIPAISITSSASSICANTIVTFSANAINGGTSPIYQWKKNGSMVGNNSSTFSDNSFTNGDIINCVLTSNANCRSVSLVTSNAITITVNKDPIVKLDPTNSLCEESSRVLDAGLFSSYLWSDGSTNRTITINSLGSYMVTVKDNNGCTGTDLTNISIILPSPKNFLPADTNICSYGNVILKPLSVFNNYLWNTGAISSSITITLPGKYWLQVMNDKGCFGKDTLEVFPKDCMKGFFIPTAFTPDNNGNNDIFKPMLWGRVKKYKFWIYNRYGGLVFYSADPSRGWNGNFKGQRTEKGAFVWICNFQFEGEQEEIKKGSFVLLY